MIKIDHIAVYVNDLENAKDFFKKYLNATSNDIYHNPKTGLRTYFLTFDNDTRLELMARPGLLSHEQHDLMCGYTHIAFSLGSRSMVDSLTSKLSDDGYVILSGPRVTGDGCYESCIRVIENLILELTE